MCYVGLVVSYRRHVYHFFSFSSSFSGFLAYGFLILIPSLNSTLWNRIQLSGFYLYFGWRSSWYLFLPINVSSLHYWSLICSYHLYCYMIVAFLLFLLHLLYLQRWSSWYSCYCAIFLTFWTYSSTRLRSDQYYMICQYYIGDLHKQLDVAHKATLVVNM